MAYSQRDNSEIKPQSSLSSLAWVNAGIHVDKIRLSMKIVSE